MEDATPTGHYSPQGDSPYGCVDMCGNIQEWTSSRYAYKSRMYVVRGGAWYHESEYVNIDSREHVLPESYYWGRGFRCMATKYAVEKHTEGLNQRSVVPPANIQTLSNQPDRTSEAHQKKIAQIKADLAIRSSPNITDEEVTNE
jgi:hypothetical protein